MSIVELTQQLSMYNEQNQQIEIVPGNRIYPNLYQSEHINPTHSIDIFIVFTLITGISKLWCSIEKMRKQGKCDSNSLLQAVGAIGIILKAIAQIKNEE
jgi:hypothetical protein